MRLSSLILFLILAFVVRGSLAYPQPSDGHDGSDDNKLLPAVTTATVSTADKFAKAHCMYHLNLTGSATEVDIRSAAAVVTVECVSGSGRVVGVSQVVGNTT